MQGLGQSNQRLAGGLGNAWCIKRKACDSQGLNEICDSQLLALTPESHSQPTAEPRPSFVGSKRFLKAERSSCGTARLFSAAMPESNCRRCLGTTKTFRCILFHQTPNADEVTVRSARFLCHTTSAGHPPSACCDALPSCNDPVRHGRTDTWTGEARQWLWWGRSVSRRSGSRRHGTVRSFARALRLCRTASQNIAGCLYRWFDTGFKNIRSQNSTGTLPRIPCRQP